MAVPDYQTLMRPLLQELAGQNGPVNIRELVDGIASQLKLADEDCMVRTPNGTDNLLYYRLRWARTYLSKAGLVTSLKRGATVITERGKEALRVCPQRVDNNYLKQYPEFAEWLAGSNQQGSPSASATPIDNGSQSAETPLERIGTARAEMDAALQSELLDRVRQMSPSEFENLIVRLLLAMGYGQGAEEMARAMGGSGDGGMDGVHQDPLGLERVYIQAKRWKEGNNVSSPEVRNFIGALNIHRAHKGVFVTASQFTPDAKSAAQGSTLQIVMIDGQRLAELMLRYKVGVLVRNSIDVMDLDEGFFDG